MHEYYAAQAVVERLTGAAGAGSVVTEVRVRASPVFSAEALQQAYEMLVLGTTLAGSHLTVEDLAVEHECGGCGAVFTVSRDDVAGHVIVCPYCGTPSAFDVAARLEVVEQ